jgi:putative effector of murein hydrolase LrgA (UPF0299 family)
MNFIEALFRALITIVLIALCFFLCEWVFAAIGLSLPAMVIVCLKILLILIGLLILIRLFWPWLSNFKMFPDRP